MLKIRMKQKISIFNKREGVGIDHFSNPKTFIQYSNDMHDVYKNIDEYNTDKENNIVIVFDDTTANMIHNNKLDSIVTELFIRGRKLNISVVFIYIIKIMTMIRLERRNYNMILI